MPIPLKGQGNPLPPNFPYRGEWMLEQLAAALNITTDSLFQANRHRELTLENVEASTPDGEMALIKRYTFRVGANEMSLSVKTLGQAGSA